MLTKQEKIDKIYSIIADKTLSKGCLVELWKGEIIPINRVQNILSIKPIYHFMYSDFTNSKSYLEKEEFADIKIIGHPVMIGDVLDYIEKNSIKDYPIWYGTVLVKYKYKRKPIEEQSEECIEDIYNLIKNYAI